MNIRSVLVVGAGIAGATLAYWLGSHGVETTVVEKSAGQRSSGSPVDVRGPALTVVERMNILPALRAAATDTTSLTLVNSAGKRLGWLPTQPNRDAVELPRGELAAALAHAAQAHAELRYNDTVRHLHDDGNGVDVTFERTPPRRFDLVVGADGLHSQVRSVLFGRESQLRTHLGIYLATMAITDFPTSSEVLLHSVPGRTTAIHPGVGTSIAAFMFRDADYSPPSRDIEQAKQYVIDTYADVGWRVPELLEQVQHSTDLYFDSISRIRLGSWSRGRCVLLGDAADCVSILGEGSSMAITGAATLAAQLTVTRATADALPEALHHYERIHRRRVTRNRLGAPAAAHFLVPASRTGNVLRNIPFRIWPRLPRIRRSGQH